MKELRSLMMSLAIIVCLTGIAFKLQAIIDRLDQIVIQLNESQLFREHNTID